jgi:hypothetical protein
MRALDGAHVQTLLCQPRRTGVNLLPDLFTSRDAESNAWRFATATHVVSPDDPSRE